MTSSCNIKYFSIILYLANAQS